MGIPPTGPLPMNFGQSQNQYAGETSSQQAYLTLNGNGRFIDLNVPYDDNNDEDLDEVKNAKEGTN